MRVVQTTGTGKEVSFIGMYDSFSASIAAKYFDGLFIGGYSFAAGFYGLPDKGVDRI